MDTARSRHLKRLLFSIRRQAALCGRYLAPSQLLSVMLSIWFASSTIYISLMLFIEGNSDYYALAGNMSFFSVFSMYRVFTKIRAGVRITAEEKEIADILKGLEFEGIKDQVWTRNEIKCIYTELSFFPTEISLSGYAKLNNSLTLSIFGQVCTLFIVFMQLNIN
ncbi:uncharacterized protein LOC118437241 [Folsomia candida]|uniref:uncharacterized protein LOC118437241 n=1 Tax=Folsomia candida TaxID=158441 RepID=UPI001604F2C8|nr:uncharacterized protein LOC118437241 [Folsomia candida]